MTQEFCEMVIFRLSGGEKMELLVAYAHTISMSFFKTPKSGVSK